MNPWTSCPSVDCRAWVPGRRTVVWSCPSVVLAQTATRQTAQRTAHGGSAQPARPDRRADPHTLLGAHDHRLGAVPQPEGHPVGASRWRTRRAPRRRAPARRGGARPPGPPPRSGPARTPGRRPAPPPGPPPRCPAGTAASPRPRRARRRRRPPPTPRRPRRPHHLPTARSRTATSPGVRRRAHVHQLPRRLPRPPRPPHLVGGEHPAHRRHVEPGQGLPRRGEDETHDVLRLGGRLHRTPDRDVDRRRPRPGRLRSPPTISARTRSSGSSAPSSAALARAPRTRDSAAASAHAPSQRLLEPQPRAGLPGRLAALGDPRQCGRARAAARRSASTVASGVTSSP